MKRILTIFALVSVAAVMGSCTKDSADSQPQVVDYVKISLVGDNPLTLALGDTFKDPGFTATDKGADAASKVEVIILDMDGEPVETIETETPGLYTINYVAESADKVSIQTSRTVYVVDPELEISLAGTFAVDFEATTCGSAPAASESNSYKDCEAYYAANGTYGAFAVDKFDITFKEIAPGIYDVNDIFGGWYNAVQGRGGYYAANYGASYATYFDMTGRIFLNADGTIVLASSYIRAWGDGVEYLKDAKYDFENETISWETRYAGSVGPMNVVAKRK